MAKQIFGYDAKDLILVGKGVEGKVYLTPDDKALKVFKTASICNSKYRILMKYQNNKHFPNVYECKGNYMLREYVDGKPFIEYIIENGLSETLAINLINMAEDFYFIGNIKLDGINTHLLVLGDESVKIIDPRKRYYTFHESLLRALELAGSGVYEKFIQMLYRIKPHLASKWLDHKTLERLESNSQLENQKNHLSKASYSQTHESPLNVKVHEEDFHDIKDLQLESNNAIKEFYEDITAEFENNEALVGECIESDVEALDSIEKELESITPVQTELENIQLSELDLEFEHYEEDVELKADELIDLEPIETMPLEDESEPINTVVDIIEKEDLKLLPHNSKNQLDHNCLDLINPKGSNDMEIKRNFLSCRSKKLAEVIVEKCKTSSIIRGLSKSYQNIKTQKKDSRNNNESPIK